MCDLRLPQRQASSRQPRTDAQNSLRPPGRAICRKSSYISLSSLAKPFVEPSDIPNLGCLPNSFGPGSTHRDESLP